MSKPRTGIPVDEGKSPFSSARQDTNSASDYSPPHSDGLKSVVNESAHGEAMATKRYGYGTQHPDMGPVHSNKPQRLGDPNNLQGNYYDNDCRNDWKRAAGETSEHSPSFVPGYRGSPRGDEHGKRGGPPLRAGGTGPHNSEPPGGKYKPTVPYALRDKGR
jgi:hypothetical protein